LISLAIGTAQFGLDYGFTNIRGKIPLYESHKILDELLVKKILRIDTASGYGDAQRVLGMYDDISRFMITTKVSYLSKNGCISSQIEGALNNLNVDSIDAVLLHDYIDIDSEIDKENAISDLRLLKSKGLCKKVGLSVYEPEDTSSIVDGEYVDVIQLPLNIFNQSFISSGELCRLKGLGIEIQVRSTFMQGVALMDNFPKEFKFTSVEFNKFINFRLKNNFSALDLCLDFIKTNCSGCKVVFAVDCIDQLSAILDSFNNDDLKMINYEEFESLDKRFINPVNWN